MKSVVRVYFRARFDPASVCVVCARVRARDCSKMTTRADNKKEFPLCFYYQTLNFFVLLSSSFFITISLSLCLVFIIICVYYLVLSFTSWLSFAR